MSWSGIPTGTSAGRSRKGLCAARAEIETEVYRLAPLVEAGGFVPTVDHAVPPDVSCQNWLTYLEVRREILGM